MFWLLPYKRIFYLPPCLLILLTILFRIMHNPIFLLLIALVPLAFAQPTCEQGTIRAGSTCQPCDPGTYQPSRNRNSCIDCPAGTFNVFPGAFNLEQCAPCGENTFSTPASTFCTPCAPGLVSRINSTVCTTCEPGFKLTLDRTHLTDEISCLPCPANFINPARSLRCTRCPDGTISSQAHTVCKPCKVGTAFELHGFNFFTDGEMAVCPECLVNTFASTRGTVQCPLCPLGTTSRRGASSCTPCPPNTFRPNLVFRRCIPCDTGLTSKGIGAAGCRHPTKGCPFNTFEDGMGECRGCLAGQRLDLTSKTCVPCANGQISQGGATTTCSGCPLNMRPATSATILEGSKCVCSPGYVDDGVQGCKPCPAGSEWFAPYENVIRIVLRRQNTFLQPVCQRCKPGFFAPQPGTVKCRLCPLNTYSTVEGSAVCYDCPPNSVSRVGDPTDKRLRYKSSRTTCFDARFGCEAGRSRRAGSIFAKKCSISTATSCLEKQFFTNFRRENCLSCRTGFGIEGFPISQSCRRCPNGNIGAPGSLMGCVQCPANSKSDMERAVCICRNGFEKNGDACKECPKRQVSFKGKCGECPAGTIFKKRSNGKRFCKPCNGPFFQATPGDKKCTRCPPGFKKARSLTGEIINSCVPSDPFSS